MDYDSNPFLSEQLLAIRQEQITYEDNDDSKD